MHMNAITVSLLAAACIAIFTTGCGSEDHGQGAPGEMSVEAVAEQGEDLNRLARRFAPECILAGDALLELARQQPEEASSYTARAKTYYDTAAAVGEAVSDGRTLVFPKDRSLGSLAVRPWDSTEWRDIGHAQGEVQIEAEYAVRLGAGPDFNDADLLFLADLGPGAIHYLTLGGSKVTVDGLSALSGIPGLTDLSLAEAHFDDSVMPYIAECLALRHLNLLSNEVTTAGLEQLVAMPALAEVILGDTNTLNDETLFFVCQLPELRSLFTRNVAFTDVGADYLRSARKLETLWIGGRAVTDHAVPLLAELPNLKDLVLMQTSISDDGVRKLIRLLPDCKLDTVS